MAVHFNDKCHTLDLDDSALYLVLNVVWVAAVKDPQILDISSWWWSSSSIYFTPVNVNNEIVVIIQNSSERLPEKLHGSMNWPRCLCESDAWPEVLYYLGSGSWMAWTYETIAHYDVIGWTHGTASRPPQTVTLAVRLIACKLLACYLFPIPQRVGGWVETEHTVVGCWRLFADWSLGPRVRTGLRPKSAVLSRSLSLQS